MKTKTTKRKSIIDKFTFKQTETEGKSCALYIRVSTEEFIRNEKGDKERRASIHAQIQDSTAYAKKRNWTYKVYDADCNISGTEDGINRPAIQELIQDIKDLKIHTIIVRDQSRFMRNEKEWHIFKQDYLKGYGVNIIGLDKPIDITTTTGELISSIEANQNQSFTVEQAKKSMRSKDDKLNKGTMRTPPCFGYSVIEKDGFRKCIENEIEAPLVKEFFDRYLKGEGIKQIYKDWIKRNVKTKRGFNPSIGAMVNILHNTAYKGVIFYNNKRYESPYPILIDAAKWEKVQEICKSKSNKAIRKDSKRNHLLTGILQCGYCVDKISKGITDVDGKKIYSSFSYTSEKRKNKNGINVYDAYVCQSKTISNRLTCPDSISISAKTIETVVIDDLAKQNIEFYKTTNKQEVNILQSLKTELIEQNEIKNKSELLLKSIDKKFSNLEIDETRYDEMNLIAKNKINKTENEIKLLEKKIEALGNDKFTKALSNMKKWDTLDIIEQKQLLNNVFDKILVYNDTLEVYYAHGLMVTFPIVKQGNKYVIDTVAGWKAIMDNLKQPSNYKFSKVQLPE